LKTSLACAVTPDQLLMTNHPPTATSAIHRMNPAHVYSPPTTPIQRLRNLSGSISGMRMNSRLLR
jgi:hypothetical protein